jgi:hypothetical protein
MSELASVRIVRLLRRLGVAIPVIVFGPFFAAIIADLVWELGLL